MLWPVLMPMCLPAQSAGSETGPIGPALTGLAVHSAAMLVVTTAIAAIVYEWLGLVVLRYAWLNVDILWMGALPATGAMLVVSAAPV
jgi:hypothetical protein